MSTMVAGRSPPSRWSCSSALGALRMGASLSMSCPPLRRRLGRPRVAVRRAGAGGARGPAPPVGDQPPHPRVEVGGVRLVAGPQVDHAAAPAPPCAPAAEHLAALEPADEHELAPGRDAEVLAVHLLLREH